MFKPYERDLAIIDKAVAKTGAISFTTASYRDANVAVNLQFTPLLDRLHGMGLGKTLGIPTPQENHSVFSAASPIADMHGFSPARPGAANTGASLTLKS